MSSKYIWIPVLVFLFIVFLAVGVSTDFKFEFNKPFEFIRSFFNQWSSALIATGTLILAVGVYITWYKSSKEKKEAIRQQRLDQIVEWASLELEEIYEKTRIISISEGVKDAWRFSVYKPIKRNIAIYNSNQIGDKTLIDLVDEVQKLGGEQLTNKLHTIILRVNELKLNESIKIPNTKEKQAPSTRWWHWFEYYTRYFVWAFGLLLACVTVIGIINDLSGITSILLLISLIIFMIAALVTWYFDVSRLFPPKKS